MVCDFCKKEFKDSDIGSGTITIKEFNGGQKIKYIESTSNACPSCLEHILFYEGKK